MDDVEEPVESKEKYDVSCDILDIIKFRDHIKLGQNGKCLQPPRERLKNSIQGPLRVDKEPKYCCDEVQIVMGKTVCFCIITLHLFKLY